MEIVLEGVLTAAAWLIYGTRADPRPRVLRLLVRVMAFGGLPIALGWLLFWPDVAAPSYLFLPWGLSLLIVVLAENDLGSRRLAYASFIGMALLIAVGLLHILR